MPRPAARQRQDPSNERAKARSFHHSSYPAERIAAERAAAAQAGRDLSVSVCLPARECAATVGQIVGALAELRRADVIDEIVVIDGASADATAEVAQSAGAVVWQEAELMPAYGPVLGKGDAMWRALTVLGGELVCFLDADTEGFSGHFATGLLGPLVCEHGFSFVKAHYRRPFLQGGVHEADGGGRVNHLTARPALELFYPQLASMRQPLAGEVAARRDLLWSLPFATGYGVEIAMLIDAWREVGLEGVAQVDLDEHQNRHQPLSALAPMALTVLATIARRLEQEGRLTGAPAAAAAGEGAGAAGGRDAARHLAAGIAPLERPPMATLHRARAEAWLRDPA